MNKKNAKNIIEILKYNFISIVILMNSLQFILSNDFKIKFNMWAEYIFIGAIFILFSFKLQNKRNIIILLISALFFCINKLFVNSETLDYYINQFELYALPIILFGLFKLDLKKFIKIFYWYSIVNLALYTLFLVINMGQKVEDYMTFGYYAIFSATYVMIYSYYKKNMFGLIFACATVPLIIINGNRGTIIVFGVAIIAIVFMGKNVVKRLFFSILIIAVLANINVLALQTLNFVTSNFNIGDSYSVRNLYNMLGSNDSEDFLGGRYEIYEEVRREIEKNLLTGMGIAKFQDLYGYFPHNIFLDAYVTFGIIGGTVYLIYLLNIGIKFYRASKENIEIQILFIFLVANTMKLLLSKTFIYDPTIWLYIVIGNQVVTNYKILKETKNEKNNSIYANI